MALTTEQIRYIGREWLTAAYPAGPTQPPVSVTRTQIAAAIQAADAGSAFAAGFRNATTVGQRTLLTNIVEAVKNPPPPPPPDPPYVDPLDEIRERLAALEAKVR